jgi:hypothetical protein
VRCYLLGCRQLCHLLQTLLKEGHHHWVVLVGIHVVTVLATRVVVVVVVIDLFTAPIPLAPGHSTGPWRAHIPAVAQKSTCCDGRTRRTALLRISR